MVEQLTLNQRVVGSNPTQGMSAGFGQMDVFIRVNDCGICHTIISSLSHQVKQWQGVALFDCRAVFRFLFGHCSWGWRVVPSDVFSNCTSEKGVPLVPTGTVSRLFELRGFGFITPDQSERDVFMGFDVIRDTTLPLHEGQRVEFTAIDAAPGIKAVSVTPIEA